MSFSKNVTVFGVKSSVFLVFDHSIIRVTNNVVHEPEEIFFSQDGIIRPDVNEGNARHVTEWDAPQLEDEFCEGEVELVSEGDETYIVGKSDNIPIYDPFRVTDGERVYVITRTRGDGCPDADEFLGVDSGDCEYIVTHEASGISAPMSSEKLVDENIRGGDFNFCLKIR